jgi:hypothetical protein
VSFALSPAVARRSAYLSDRNVSANLVRTIRGYFNARYDVMSAFVDHELAYFQQLPGSLRLELARQLRYVDHHSDDSRVGLLSRVSEVLRRMPLLRSLTRSNRLA